MKFSEVLAKLPADPIANQRGQSKKLFANKKIRIIT
jgi:hypothetical protein